MRNSELDNKPLSDTLPTNTTESGVDASRRNFFKHAVAGTLRSGRNDEYCSTVSQHQRMGGG